MAEQAAGDRPAEGNRPTGHGPSDEQVEQFIGNLLRSGVLLSALVVLAGGILFLARHGRDPAPNYQVFEAEPAELRDPLAILRAAGSGQSGSLIQLGLVLLIATPVARVVFSVFAFLRQRDYLYAIVTLIVLVVLLYSLFSGHAS